MPDPSVSSIPLQALDRPIAYHRIFRTVSGSTVAAVFLSQAWYWTQRLPDERDGWFYKTQEDWEEETGLSRREQATARKHLKENHILQEELRGLPATMWYRINTAHLARSIQRAIKYGGTAHTGLAEPANQDSANAPIIHTETTAETTPENTLSPEDTEPDLFDLFWQVYPRREGKATARKAWTKAIAKADVETILLSLDLQINNNWQGRDKQYIPLPASWLNGERWDDEIIRPKTNGNGQRTPEYIDKHGNYTVEGSLARARGEI